MQSKKGQLSRADDFLPKNAKFPLLMPRLYLYCVQVTEPGGRPGGADERGGDGHQRTPRRHQLYPGSADAFL